MTPSFARLQNSLPNIDDPPGWWFEPPSGPTIDHRWSLTCVCVCVCVCVSHIYDLWLHFHCDVVSPLYPAVPYPNTFYPSQVADDAAGRGLGPAAQLRHRALHLISRFPTQEYNNSMSPELIWTYNTIRRALLFVHSNSDQFYGKNHIHKYFTENSFFL